MEVLWPLGGEGCYHGDHGVVVIGLLVSQQRFMEPAVRALVQRPFHVAEVGGPEELRLISPRARGFFSICPRSSTGVLP